MFKFIFKLSKYLKNKIFFKKNDIKYYPKIQEIQMEIMEEKKLKFEKELIIDELEEKKIKKNIDIL